MDIGTLAIRDRVFAVTSAQLNGYITTEGDRWVCKWHVDIETQERTFYGEDPEHPDIWRPSAYIHHLRFGGRSWRDFDGAVFAGEDEQGRELSVLNDGTAYRLYVYEHAEVANNHLAFSNRDGTLFDLIWTGAAAVYADEEFCEDIPFRVQTRVQFKGVDMSLSTLNKEAPPPPVAEIFASALDPAAFVQLPTRETQEPSGHRRWQTHFDPA
jgi:hypothetical protein